jgi:hypothetical protein
MAVLSFDPDALSRRDWELIQEIEREPAAPAVCLGKTTCRRWSSSRREPWAAVLP